MKSILIRTDFCPTLKIQKIFHVRCIFFEPRLAVVAHCEYKRLYG